MISVEKAKEIILTKTKVITEIENVHFTESYKRILARGIISGRNIPELDNSSMDGYALISGDTINATKDNPVILNIISEIQAGADSTYPALSPGNAIRIMTGAHMPAGADAVVPFEDTEESGHFVKVFRPVSRFEYIRFAGEDVTAGKTVLHPGLCIDSVHIGQIASVNLTEVSVYKKPQVSIISTGNEILEPGSAGIFGKTINSNAYVIMNEVKKYGGNPKYIGLARDTHDNIKMLIESALSGDIIISSGGVSMGRYDFIPDVLKSLGAEIIIHTIAMKPGKPVLFAKIKDKLFFGLPGNPVSAMVAFMEFVRPSLLKMSGALHKEKPIVKAILEETINKNRGRKYFIRGIFRIKDGNFYVVSTGSQGSGILRSMAEANCLIILPEEIEVAEKNSFVDIQLINHGEISFG